MWEWFWMWELEGGVGWKIGSLIERVEGGIRFRRVLILLLSRSRSSFVDIRSFIAISAFVVSVND